MLWRRAGWPLSHPAKPGLGVLRPPPVRHALYMSLLVPAQQASKHALSAGLRQRLLGALVGCAVCSLPQAVPAGSQQLANMQNTCHACLGLACRASRLPACWPALRKSVSHRRTHARRHATPRVPPFCSPTPPWQLSSGCIGLQAEDLLSPQPQSALGNFAELRMPPVTA